MQGISFSVESGATSHHHVRSGFAALLRHRQSRPKVSKMYQIATPGRRIPNPARAGVISQVPYVEK
jgi:hypothetical protein